MAWGYSPTFCPVLLEVSNSSAFTSEMRAQISCCCGHSTCPQLSCHRGHPSAVAAASALAGAQDTTVRCSGLSWDTPCWGGSWQSQSPVAQGAPAPPREGQMQQPGPVGSGRWERPYHRRSPARRGSQRLASSGPPPASHSWCHTGRFGSPTRAAGTATTPCPQPFREPPPKKQPQHTARPQRYLLAVLQLVHPELGALEAAAVGEVWERSVRPCPRPPCPPQTHCHRHRPRALTVADDGSSRPAVIDAAHGLVALGARRVLGERGGAVSSGEGGGVGGGAGMVL